MGEPIVMPLWIAEEIRPMSHSPSNHHSPGTFQTHDPALHQPPPHFSFQPIHPPPDLPPPFPPQPQPQPTVSLPYTNPSYTPFTQYTNLAYTNPPGANFSSPISTPTTMVMSAPYMTAQMPQPTIVPPFTTHTTTTYSELANPSESNPTRAQLDSQIQDTMERMRRDLEMSFQQNLQKSIATEIQNTRNQLQVSSSTNPPSPGQPRYHRFSHSPTSVPFSHVSLPFPSSPSGYTHPRGAIPTTPMNHIHTSYTPPQTTFLPPTCFNSVFPPITPLPNHIHFTPTTTNIYTSPFTPNPTINHHPHLIYQQTAHLENPKPTHGFNPNQNPQYVQMLIPNQTPITIIDFEEREKVRTIVEQKLGLFFDPRDWCMHFNEIREMLLERYPEVRDDLSSLSPSLTQKSQVFDEMREKIVEPLWYQKPPPTEEEIGLPSMHFEEDDEIEILWLEPPSPTTAMKLARVQGREVKAMKSNQFKAESQQCSVEEFIENFHCPASSKLLLAYAGSASNVRVERASRNSFKGAGAVAEVMSLYENISEDNSSDHCEQKMESTDKGNHCLATEGILTMPDLAVQALALMIHHLKQFGLERILCIGASFRPFSSNMEMTFSTNALQQLEVLKNNSDRSEAGSLLQSMNHTLTIVGSRLWRHWVTHPLWDRNMIYARLDAVSEIAESMGPSKVSQNLERFDKDESDLTILQSELNYLLSSILTILGRSADIQHGITRIFHRTATASEFIAVIQAILLAAKQLHQLHIEDNGTDEKMQSKIVNSVLLRKLILTASSSSVIGNVAKLLSSLNKDAADQRDLLNLFIISTGQFPEVPRARTEVHLAKEKLDLLITLYRKQLGVHNLEFTSVSGTTHLIEISLNVRVPSNWVKVNSTKKMIRYHPPEIMNALDELPLTNIGDAQWHLIGSEGLLSWWPPDDKNISSDFSEGYILLFYEAVSQYESDVHTLVGGLPADCTTTIILEALRQLIQLASWLWWIIMKASFFKGS